MTGQIEYDDQPITPVYGRDEVAGGAPDGIEEINLSKSKLLDTPLPADSVYQVIKNELLMDMKPGLNLATFCNEAYTDPWGIKVISDSIKKNFIDYTEYPGTILTEKRSIRMIARELGTTFDEDDPSDPHEEARQNFYGTATIGSSEAIMLGLISHKFIWNLKHRVLLKYETQINTNATNQIKADPRDRPVILMSAHVHACWDKFCRYYDVVPLYVPQSDAPYAIHNGDIIKGILETPINDTSSINKDYAKKLRDTIFYGKNDPHNRVIGELVMTVGTCVGTTFTGNSDNVPAIDKAVDDFCKEQNEKYTQQGTFKEKYKEEYKLLYPQQKQPPQRIPDLIDIPIHVDTANGFALVFSPKREKYDAPMPIPFCFRETERVLSINLSNHKFGMTFTGMGSVIFRDSKVVDPALIYEIPYLGGSFENYTVNFSRGSAMIVMQYYNFLRFGRDGYQAIIKKCLDNTKWFLDQLTETTVVEEKKLSDYLKNISNYDVEDSSAPDENKVDLPIIALTWADTPPESWDLTDVSDKLAEKGWMVPSYTLSVNSPDENSDSGTEVLRVVVQQVVTREKLRALLWDMAEVIGDLIEVAKDHEIESTTAAEASAIASLAKARLLRLKSKKAPIARRTGCLC
ncbi:MAG: hypothetical protein F6K47_33695 [Symploca sp. SIO2E6]|nr:hypothetical protein [Symploca sp. SIO2E6]